MVSIRRQSCSAVTDSRITPSMFLLNTFGAMSVLCYYFLLLAAMTLVTTLEDRVTSSMRIMFTVTTFGMLIDNLLAHVHDLFLV